MSDQQDRAGRAGMLLVGIVLLVIGLSFIGNLGWERLVPAFGPLQRFATEIRLWTPGLALVVLGVLFVVFGSREGARFHRPAAGTKLYRSRDSKMVAGVLGGLGEYFSVDPTLLRLAFVALVLWTNGPFVIAYIVMAIVVPYPPEGYTQPVAQTQGASAANPAPVANPAPSAPEPPAPPAPPAPPQG